MKNLIYNALWIIGLFAVIFVSCDDNIDPVIEELSYSRVMSVTDISTTVSQRSVIVDFTEISNADYYILEFYNDSVIDFNDETLGSGNGTFVESDTVTSEELPFTTTLISEEMYSVRVQSCSNSLEDSKWYGTTFETEAENLFETLVSDSITKNSVTLNWTAGSDVNYFKVKASDSSSSTDSIRIDEDEIAAGQAKITGLSYETEYQVTLYQDGNEKRRGRVTFTTKADGVTLSSGTDIATAINTDYADENVFFLEAGSYSSTEAIVVDRNIKIMPVSTEDTVVISSQFKFTCTDAISLNVQDVELDGASTFDDLFSFSNSALGSISLSGCYIHDYTDDFFYLGKSGFAMEALTVDDCIIENFGCSHSFIDIRDAFVTTISFTNSTIANCGPSQSSSYFVRVDGATKGPNSFDDGANNPDITVSKCTLYNNFTAGTKSLFYMRWDEDGALINFTNNIVAGTASTAYACGLYDTSFGDPVVTLSNNFYYQATTIVEDDATGTDLSTTDPFSSASESDFTVTNSTVISAGAGDPRWITE